MVGHAAIFALENVCYWHKADMPVAVMALRLGESNKTASGYSNLVRNFRSPVEPFQLSTVSMIDLPAERGSVP